MGSGQDINSAQYSSEEQPVRLPEFSGGEIHSEFPVTDRMQSVFISMTILFLFGCIAIGGFLIVQNKRTLFPEPEQRRANLADGVLYLSGSDTTVQEIKDQQEKQHQELMKNLRSQQEEMRAKLKESQFPR